MKTSYWIWILTTFVLIPLLLHPVSATSFQDEQDSIINVLKVYYTASTHEILEEYYSVMSSEGFSEEDILERKEQTKALWEEFDTLDYSLESIIPTVEGNTAHVYYTLSATISDTSGEEMSFTREMVAILFKEKGDWKVWAIMPRASYQLRMSTYGEELGIETNEAPEPKKTGNIEDFFDGLMGRTDDPLSQPLNSKCGNKICEDGETTSSCSEDCPKIGLCSYGVEKIQDLDGTDLKKTSSNIPDFAKKIILGDGTAIVLALPDEGNEYYFTIHENILHTEDKLTGEADYVLQTSSCTLKDLLDKNIDIASAYRNKDISIKGKGIGPSLKTGTISLFLKVQSWFKKKEKTSGNAHARFAVPLRGPVVMKNY